MKVPVVSVDGETPSGGRCNVLLPVADATVAFVEFEDLFVALVPFV